MNIQNSSYFNAGKVFSKENLKFFLELVKSILLALSDSCVIKKY